MKAAQKLVSRRVVQLHLLPARSFSMRHPSVSHSSLREIADHGFFERQVYARFGEHGGEGVHKLVLKSVASMEIANRVASQESSRGLNNLFASKGVQGLPENAKPHLVSHEFELDLCLLVNTEVRLRDLFDICCEEDDVFAFLPQIGGACELRNGFENATTDNSAYIHFETTRAPSKAVEKVLQLERTIALKSECLPEAWERISATGVFINGDRDEFLSLVNSVHRNWQVAINQELRITQVPLYLAYDPIRNLYSSMRNVMDEQQELRSSVDELRTGLEELHTGLEELRTGLEELRTGLEELRTGLEELRTGQEELGNRLQRIEHILSQLVNT